MTPLSPTDRLLAPPPPAVVAHPVWALRAAPALGSADMVGRLRRSRRTAGRLAALLKRRLELPSATVVDWEADGRRFVLGDPGDLEARLLFLGAVANGPAVATAVSRLAVSAMASVLGESGLRAAISVAHLGRQSEPLGPASPTAVRARFAASAARHLGAWLDRQPPSLRHRVLMALPPEGDLDPYGAAALSAGGADPDLLPRLAAHRPSPSRAQTVLAA